MEPSPAINSPLAVRNFSVTDEFLDEHRPRIKRLILFLLIAILFHLLIFYLRPDFLRPTPPAPIEVQQIDPSKLEAIKRAWKNRPLVIDKNPTSKSEEKAPENARFESARNHTVAKETRARVTDVIPHPGILGPGSNPAEKSGTEKSQPEKAQPNKTKAPPLAKFSNLQNVFDAPQAKPSEETPPEESSQRGKTVQNNGESAGGGGADQAILDKNIPEGAENVLNTVESVYYSFFERMYKTIGPQWQSRIREILPRLKPRDGTYTTQVDVVLDAEGNYIGCHIMQSSGIQGLDEAIDYAWKKLPRFPNPPRALIQSDGNLHLGWSFVVQIDGQGWNYLPPQRTY